MLKVVRIEDKYFLKFLGGSKPNKSLMTARKFLVKFYEISVLNVLFA
jgi:hypothetical protein